MNGPQPEDPSVSQHAVRKRFPKLAVALLGAALLVVIGWYATVPFRAAAAPRPEIADLWKIRALGVAAQLFANENDGMLPSVEEWEQWVLLCFKDPDLLESSVLPSSGRAFAMNEHLSSVRLADIPDAGTTVLFFECAPGSPKGGGPELLPPSPRYPGGYSIGFANGGTATVASARLADLIWRPHAAPSAAEQLVDRLTNSDVTWGGNYGGLWPQVTGTTAETILSLGSEAIPALFAALDDPQKFAAAHVLLTRIHCFRYSVNGDEWNGLRVGISWDGHVDLHPDQIPRIKALWHAQLGGT